MHSFLPEWLQLVLAILLVVVLGLVHAARDYPAVEWLRPFRFADHLTPQQREHRRRSAHMHTAIEFILFGFAIPIGYVGLTLLTWSDFSPRITLAVAAGSAACFGIGAWMVWHGGKRN